jgi:hypothetical protein
LEVKMVFQGCNRCVGDLYVEDDLGGPELVCLQCGNRIPQGALATVAPADDGSLIRWLHTQRAMQSA